MTMPSHSILPDLPSGYPLRPFRGWLRIIVPEATVNLITNPSLETNTTGYTAYSGASISQSITQQRRGAYSLRIVTSGGANQGVYYTTPISLTSGTAYTWSLDLYIPAGVQITLSARNLDGTVYATRYITGQGRWQREAVTWTAQATAVHQLLVFLTRTTSTITGALLDNNNAGLFDSDGLPLYDSSSTATGVTPTLYTDGWQVEAKAYPTTYCDGDQQGLIRGQVAYRWRGGAHNSASERAAQTATGGRAYDVQEDLGLRITALQGLGLPEPQSQALPYAIRDGSFYVRTTHPARSITLVGQLNEGSAAQVQRLRAALSGAVQVNAVSPQQPVRLIYQELDGCGQAVGDEIYFDGVYAGGLEGNRDNLYGERLAIRLTAYDPSLQAVGEMAGTLTALGSSQNHGAWQYDVLSRQMSALGATGLNAGARIHAWAIGPDGTIYAGGSFTSINGVTAYRIAAYADGVWTALGNGLNNNVYALAVGPDGTVYAGGVFTADGTGAGTYRRFASYTPATLTWAEIGGGITTGSEVDALAVDSSGNVVVGGTFTQVGGATAVLNVARRNVSAGTWSTLNGGLQNTAGPSAVLALAIARDGTIYAGGTFDSDGTGTPNVTDNLAAWNGSAWSEVGGGANTTVRALALSASGLLYVGGDFTTLGSVSAQAIGLWNGAVFTNLAASLAGSTIIYDLSVGPDGTLYAAGTFTSIAGRAVPGPLAMFNGTTWVPLPLLTSATIISAIQATLSSTVLIGTSQASSYTVAGRSTIGGPTGSEVRAGLVVTITGEPSGTSTRAVYGVWNETTGAAIWFDDLVVYPTEVLTLDCRDGGISLVSSTRGPLPAALALDSAQSLSAAPGDVLGVLLNTGGSVTLPSPVYRFRPRYLTVDAAVG